MSPHPTADRRRSSPEGDGRSRTTRGRAAGLVLLATVALTLLATGAVAGVTAADAALLQEDTAPDADVEYFDGATQDGTVVVDADRQYVNFSAFDTNDPDHQPGELEYEWSVGESASGDLASLGELNGNQYDFDTFARYEVADADAGETFEVTIEVTDPDGQSDAASIPVRVVEDAAENEPPVADLAWADDPSVEQPTVAVEDGTVELTAEGTTDADDDLADLEFEWATDDSVHGDLAVDGATATYDLVDADAGETLAFEVTATDAAGDSDVDELSVVVEPDDDDEGDDEQDDVPQPTATIEYVNAGTTDDVTVDASTESLTLSGLSSEPRDDRANLTYDWSLGPNASGELAPDAYPQNFTTRYDVSPQDVGSTVEVQLTVTYRGETTDTDTFAVTVLEPDTEPPEAAITTTGETEPEEVTGETLTVDSTVDRIGFSATGSTDPNFDAEELDVEWETDGAGELTVDDDGVARYAIANADRGDTVTVELTVRNPDGAVDSATVELELATESAEAPTAVVEYVDDPDANAIDVHVENGSLTFTGTASSDPNGGDSTLAYDWSIDGDAAGELGGADEYDEDYFATYQLADEDAGATFDVVLTVTNEWGVDDTDRVTVSVAGGNETDGGEDDDGDDSDDNTGGGIPGPGPGDDTDDTDDTDDDTDDGSEDSSDDGTDDDSDEESSSDDETDGESEGGSSDDDPATAPDDSDREDGDDGGLGTLGTVLIVGIVGGVGALVFYLRP